MKQFFKSIRSNRKSKPQTFKEQLRQTITQRPINDDALHKLLLQYQKDLLPNLADKLKIPLEDVRKLISCITVSNRDDVNSYCIPNENRTSFQIYMNFGLLHFQYKIFKLFVAHFGVGDSGNIIESPQLSGKIVAEAASRLIHAYWTGTIREAQTIHVMDLSDFQIKMLWILMTTAEKYILAHELGHIAIQVAHDSLEEELCGREFAEKMVKKSVEGRDDLVNQLSNELAADLIGLDLVMGTVEDSSGIYYATVLGGCEAVFSIREMLHRFKSDDPEEEILVDLPPRYRINYLRYVLQTDPKMTNAFFQMGDMIQNLTRNILFRVKELSAKKGDAKNQYWLSRAYETGNDIDSNPAEAIHWLKRAAQGGYSNAQYSLGNRYYEGQGIEKDPYKAAQWFKLAADQGDRFAMFNLANAYRKGDGATKDEALAVSLYIKSAEYGIPYAQANLAGCFRDGIGIPKNCIEACRWFTIAQNSGLIDVAELIRSLEKNMSKADIQRARKLALEWKRNPIK